MTCIAQIIIIAVSSRYLGATIPFVLAVFIFTQRLYIRTSRQLRFFDIKAKGPLYTEFIELLEGLSVVRAFNMQGAFQQRLAAALDTSQKPFYLLFCAQRWLGLVLNLVNLGLALILVGVTTATRADLRKPSPDSDLALNSLTLSVPAGTKLSVCGRSGR